MCTVFISAGKHFDIKQNLKHLLCIFFFFLCQSDAGTRSPWDLTCRKTFLRLAVTPCRLLTVQSRAALAVIGVCDFNLTQRQLFTQPEY